MAYFTEEAPDYLNNPFLGGGLSVIDEIEVLMYKKGKVIDIFLFLP